MWSFHVTAQSQVRNHMTTGGPTLEDPLSPSAMIAFTNREDSLHRPAAVLLPPTRIGLSHHRTRIQLRPTGLRSIVRLCSTDPRSYLPACRDSGRGRSAE